MDKDIPKGELPRKNLLVYTNCLRESRVIYTEGFDRKAGQHYEPFYILGNF